jgi:hypothetical protein
MHNSPSTRPIEFNLQLDEETHTFSRIEAEKCTIHEMSDEFNFPRQHG